MIDVTLACEDANSKLVDVVTVAYEDHVGNNLLQISKLRFGQTLSTRFGQDFEVEVQARFEADQFFFCWCSVEIMKLNLGLDSEASFGQDFEA